jgi:hypothetical protein
MFVVVKRGSKVERKVMTEKYTQNTKKYKNTKIQKYKK